MYLICYKLHMTSLQNTMELKVASMSMGKLGVISRLCGEAYGSCITFGTIGRCQCSRTDGMKLNLVQILNIIHNNLY